MSELTESKGAELSTNMAAGIAGEFNQTDVQQGRLAIMQSGSTLVKEEKARQGSIINLLDGEELAYKGNDKEPAKDLEFLICGIVKYWIEKNADTDTFISKFPAIDANELPWNEMKDGVNIERTFHFSYMVLLPEEIAAGIEMPYELAFRSTLLKDVKKLNSLIKRMGQKGVSSHSKVFYGKIAKRANEKNDWFGLDLGVAREATEEEQKTVENYFNNFVKYRDNVMSQTDATESSEAKTQYTSDDY